MATVSLQRSEVENQYSVTAGSYQMDLTLGAPLHPSSIDFLLLSLGSCIIGTVSHYMARKELPTEGLAIRLSCELDEKANRYGDISATLNLGDGIPEAQIARISGIAKMCRIHRTLEQQPQVKLEVIGVGD
jgi:uncharacterized OsmC-like protein